MVYLPLSDLFVTQTRPPNDPYPGFTDGRQAYSGYPNALLCIRFMHQSGSIVVGDRSFTPSLGFPSAVSGVLVYESLDYRPY